MSKEKKLPPIQLAPVKHFTIRLVDGHFVRVPRVETIAETDSTRPPSVLRQETSAHGDGTVVHRKLRLVNGHFVNDADPAPVQIPPTPGTAGPAAQRLAPPKEPAPDSWASAFSTQPDPTDSPPKT